MGDLKIVRQATNEWLSQTGVFDWPLQEKSVCTFPIFYNADASFYILYGEARVTASGEDEVHLTAGDFITLPKGAACYWEILQPMQAHTTSAKTT